MIPRFSLKYGDVFYSSESLDAKNTKSGLLYTLPDGVKVTLKAKEYSEFDAVEWVLCFENTSLENSEILSEISDCDVLLPLDIPPETKPGYMPKDGSLCVISMKGMVDGSNYWKKDALSASEFEFTPEWLEKGQRKKSFANFGARSSDTFMPFFDVTAKGKGYICAIGWSGGWSASFERTEGGCLMKSGLSDAEFYLKPGEKIRTTSVLIMKYDDADEKHNKFRTLIREHFSHKNEGRTARDGLMAFELWGGLPTDEMKKRIGELKECGIKFEEIWIDAGWYGNCTNCTDTFSGDWGTKTGDWFVNENVHPGKLSDVAECARDANMNLMLWIEAERAVKGTEIYKEHPEWFMDDGRGGMHKVLRLGNEEAYNYIKETICHYIKELKLSCYRQDSNVPLSDYFSNNDEEGRRGITEITHITKLYELWDYLLSEFSGLIIDNCASGGRRIDIETLKRSIPFFRSDYQCNFNENSEVLQAHNANISCYIPYNGCTSKTKNDDYAIRSSYSASWGGAYYNAIFQDMTEEDFIWAKKISDEYLRIRKYFPKDFYNHGSVRFDDTSWAIFQYHDKESDSGIVLAFRREKSPFDTANISLKGVKGEYTFENLNDGTKFNGSAEMKITLPDKRSSVIFEYRK